MCPALAVGLFVCSCTYYLTITYLPRAWLSGELKEYRAMADKTGFVAKRQSHRTWFEMLKEQLIRQANREIKTQRVLREAIKWMGGKYRLKKTIVNMIPEHLCYCEPFGGAGWVLFAKGPSQVEVYNDINKELINFFKVIKNNPVEFLDRTNGLLISRELFQGFLAAHPLDLTEVERAVRFYYLLHFSFGARMKSFLITPFGNEEHARLRDCLAKIQGKFLLSINDHPDIRELYRGFNIEGVSVRYSIARKDKSSLKKELLISNYQKCDLANLQKVA